MKDRSFDPYTDREEELTFEARGRPMGRTPVPRQARPARRPARRPPFRPPLPRRDRRWYPTGGGALLDLTIHEPDAASTFPDASGNCSCPCSQSAEPAGEYDLEEEYGPEAAHRMGGLAAANGRWVRRGPIIVVDLERGGSFAGESQEEILDGEFDFSSFPGSVLEALRKGLEGIAIQISVKSGFRDETRLTNLIFYARHPERGGRPIAKSEPGSKALSQEWLNIRDRLVRPALASAKPAGPLSPVGGALQYGVPGGKILSGYLKKRSHGYHTGIDVSTSTSPGKGADDTRRGLPVYATVRTSIDIATLNSVQVALKKAPPWKQGLGIRGQGLAVLREVRVRVKSKANRAGYEYGGVVGLACRYAYTKTDGTPGLFTLFVEYWHLIVPGYLPKNGQGRILSIAEWSTAGKGNQIGLGPKMKDGAILRPADFASPPLVGYLGATQWPHVHIHANYGDGEHQYILYPRLDPTAVIY